MTEASINEFVTSECEFGRAFRISSADFYGAYEKWCEESGQLPASQQISSRQVRDGTDSRWTNQQRFRIGIRQYTVELKPRRSSVIAPADWLADLAFNEAKAISEHISWIGSRLPAE